MTVAAALLSSARPDWCTPTVVLKCVRAVDAIGLDPCPSPSDRVRAALAFRDRDGLLEPWGGHGLAYVNPPYGRGVGAWTAKLVEEARRDVEAIALLPARTDTTWWQRDCVTAQAGCFWKGRLVFLGAAQGAPFPSVVLYWGKRTTRFVEAFAGCGWIVAAPAARRCLVEAKLARAHQAAGWRLVEGPHRHGQRGRGDQVLLEWSGIGEAPELRRRR